MNGSNFEREMARQRSVTRIVVGQPQEELRPWQWALAFVQTNWNLTRSPRGGLQMLMVRHACMLL